ncbi:MAG: hypothetical protein CUN52_11825 [Phototrophicales bacterium]|nr:MAG: hypothetical protein CUN52_11825 [Phototrophicales bacterium]
MVMMMKKTTSILIVMILIGSMMVNVSQHNVYIGQAQPPTPTTAPLIIPTIAPLPTIGATLENTPLPTFTPTEPGPVQLEAKESAGAVNVRIEADPNAERLGTIRFGQRYVVVGRYYLWYRIRYDQSPNGMGYVFGDLVDIIGDPNEIVDLTLFTPTPTDPNAVNLTATFEIVRLTPGGELTLTVAVREILPPGQQVGVLVQDATASPRPILPTFTYPPNIIAQAPSPNAEVTILTPTIVTSNTPRGDVAPIVPIMVLGGLGIIGLLLSRLFSKR